MATSYGSYQNHARVRFDYSVADPTPSATHSQVIVYAYLEMDGSSSQSGVSGSIAWSGSWGSGSEGTTFSIGPGGAQLINSWVHDLPLTDAVQTLTFGQVANHYFGATSHSVAFNVPPRWAVTPSSLTVARVSDGQQNLAWTRNSTYSSVVVQCRTDGGAWQEVGRPVGNAAAFSDTTTVANRRYEYRVAGIGGSGQSGWSGIATVYTTPAPPSLVEAQKVGSNIQVTASGLPAWATGYDIQERQGAGSWTTLQVGVTSWPWTHVSPSNAVTHTYRVRSTRGALASAYSAESNTVQLLAAPNPPTGLTPNGGTLEATVPQPLTWVHAPVDTTAQSAYELSYRLIGAGSWTTVSGTTQDFRLVNLPAGEYEWQVRTKGAHPDWSPWSAVATFSMVSAPGVAIVQPGGSWGQPVLPLEWSWTQAQGRPQSAWQVRLTDDASTLLEEREGSGAATSVTLTTRLVTGESYVVRVRAATGTVWSGWATQTFTTLFVPPAMPDVSGGWDEASGSVSLTVNEGSEDPAPPSTVSVIVERSVDDGDTWEAALSAAPGVTFADWESLSYGTTLYRVTAVAASGAAATLVYPVVAESGALWLSGGVGFSRTARLPMNPSIRLRAARARSVQRYEGRSSGVAYAGEQTSLVVEVGGALIDRDPDTAEVDALIDVIQNREPVHLVRDPDGRRVYGSVSDVTLPRKTVIDRATGWAGVWEYGFSLEETDH